MNAVLKNTKPLSQMLGEVAVLAKINVACLGLTRLDKQAAVENDEAHGAKRGTSKAPVNRMPGAEIAIDRIKQFHTKARAVCAGMTTQWGTDRRLLMNTLIGDFSGEINDIIYEHDQAVQEFVAQVSDYIAKAQVNLGTYNVQPPTEDEVKHAFRLSFDLSPVPDVSAYSAPSDRSLEKQLKKQFEENMQADFVNAQKDMFQRLAKPLDNMMERLAKYEDREADKAKGIKVGHADTFKSTLVTNVTDIGKIVRASNVFNDPFINSLAERLEAFEGIEHADLTNSKELRADMAKRAKDIRESLGGWL